MSACSTFSIVRNAVRSPRDSVCWSCLHRIRAKRATTRSIASSTSKTYTSSSTPTASTPSSPAGKITSATTTLSAPKKESISTPPKSPKTAKFSLPDKRGDDFVPPVLQHALGLPERPQPGQNSGNETRTWRQRRDDFHNYEKHLQRRKQLKDKLYRPYFRDWTNMNNRQGKTFLANPKILRPESALYFPNLCGTTLASGGKIADTTPVLTGRVSVVTVFSSAWAEDQARSFTDAKRNAELRAVLAQSERMGLAQQVDINVEENPLKAALIRLFEFRLRKMRESKDWGRYFLVRRGLTGEMREAMGILNKNVGYVYLVDAACRIRWAGSGVAEGEEGSYLVNGFNRLVEQLKMKSTSRVGDLAPLKTKDDRKQPNPIK